MSRSKHWCRFVIDDDMNVNGVEHQTVYCGKPVAPGEKYCVEHARESSTGSQNAGK